MKIEKEDDVTGESARQLRESLGLSQEAFWGAVRVPGARGCAYETNRTAIRPEVQRLVYLHYVLGLPTDINSKELKELASIAAPARRARRKMDLAKDFIGQAGAILGQAKEVLDA